MRTMLTEGAARHRATADKLDVAKKLDGAALLAAMLRRRAALVEAAAAHIEDGTVFALTECDMGEVAKIGVSQAQAVDAAVSQKTAQLDPFGMS
jgi:hypothetical protein